MEVESLLFKTDSSNFFTKYITYNTIYNHSGQIMANQVFELKQQMCLL